MERFGEVVSGVSALCVSSRAPQLAMQRRREFLLGILVVKICVLVLITVTMIPPSQSFSQPSFSPFCSFLICSFIRSFAHSSLSTTLLSQYLSQVDHSNLPLIIWFALACLFRHATNTILFSDSLSSAPKVTRSHRRCYADLRCDDGQKPQRTTLMRTLL